MSKEKDIRLLAIVEIVVINISRKSFVNLMSKMK
jgi:hypothetical protein